MELFQECDRNGDGKVGFEELLEHAEQNHLDAAEMRAVFESLDINGDKAVTYAELLKGYELFAGSRPLSRLVQPCLRACDHELVSTCSSHQPSRSAPPTSHTQHRIHRREDPFDRFTLLEGTESSWKAGKQVSQLCIKL